MEFFKYLITHGKCVVINKLDFKKEIPLELLTIWINNAVLEIERISINAKINEYNKNCIVYLLVNNLL